MEFQNHMNLQGSQTNISLFIIEKKFQNHMNLQGSQTSNWLSPNHDITVIML